MSRQSAAAERRRKRYTVSAWLGAAALLLLWLSLVSGTDGVRVSETAALLRPWSGTEGLIFGQIRLPRALGAFAAGAALGLSGALMQGALRNPLASPYTLGIAHAAGFGASFAIVVLQAYGAQTAFGAQLTVAGLAFVASMACSVLIVWLGRYADMRPGSLILLGVALGSLFGASTMFLQYFATDTDAAATLFWTFGDMGKADWTNVAVTLGVTAAVLYRFWRGHWQLDALGFGDESAKSLGVAVEGVRLETMLLGALLASTAVAYFGIIGFVGLVAPHLVRLVAGGAHAALLPISALAGGVLLMGADLAARLVLLPAILPVGILTAFLGVPLFIYLLVTRGRRWD